MQRACNAVQMTTGPRLFRGPVVEAPGIESPDTSVPSAADRRESPRADTTQGNAERREVSASVATVVDVVEAALAGAIGKATAAGEWTIVAQLARELEARRIARAASNVVAFARRSKR